MEVKRCKHPLGENSIDIVCLGEEANDTKFFKSWGGSP